MIDYDYIDKLSPEEKLWLNQFTAEYATATLDRKNLDNNLHNTIELKKDCDKRNYSRRHDLFLNLKVNNLIDSWEFYKQEAGESDALVDEFEDLDSADDYTNEHSKSRDDDSGEF